MVLRSQAVRCLTTSRVASTIYVRIQLPIMYCCLQNIFIFQNQHSGGILDYFFCFCLFSVVSTVITQKIVALSFSTLVFLVRHSGLLDSFFYLCNIDFERIEGKQPTVCIYLLRVTIYCVITVCTSIIGHHTTGCVMSKYSVPQLPPY